MMWIAILLLLIIFGCVWIPEWTKKTVSQYPCIERTPNGYIIINHEKKYLTKSKANWFNFPLDNNTLYIQDFEVAKEIFHEYIPIVEENIELGRVYGLEHIQKEKEIKSKTALLEEIIAVDKKEGKNTDVLESILLRQKEELLA